MPKAFSVVSWCVEHFKNAYSRLGDVIALLARLNPDVFALYEVEGKEFFGEFVKKMPGYQLHIAEGPHEKQTEHLVERQHQPLQAEQSGSRCRRGPPDIQKVQRCRRPRARLAGGADHCRAGRMDPALLRPRHPLLRSAAGVMKLGET